MGDADLDVSNGTCYYDVEAPAADNFIPCGNAEAAGLDYACCNEGDYCLSSSACYNTQFGITYLAGCTDHSYGAPACPGKGPYAGQQLVGLARCDPEDAKWAGCEDKEGRTKPEERNSNCTCEGQEPLFEDAPRLANIASLPDSLGGTISWEAGYSPTAAASAQTTRATTRATTTTTATATSSRESPDATSDQGVPETSTADADADADAAAPAASALSDGAKAGIGAGAAALYLLLSCLALVFFRRKRRRQRQRQRQRPQDDDLPVGLGHPGNSPPPPAGPAAATSANTAYLAGFKSELPAEVPANTRTSSSSPPPHPHYRYVDSPGLGDGLHGGGGGGPGSNGEGTPGLRSSSSSNSNQERFSAVSTLLSSRGGAYSPNPAAGSDGNNPGHASMATISELHG